MKSLLSREILERRFVGFALVVILVGGVALLAMTALPKRPSDESMLRRNEPGIVIFNEEATGTQNLYLGQLQGVSRKEFRLPVHNRSGETVWPRIERVSCGCLSARFQSGAIPPGGTGFLCGSLDSRGRSHGFVTQTAYFRLNGASGADVQSLTVSASIPGYWAAPSSLSIPAELAVRGESVEFSVFLLGDGDLDATEITAVPPFVSVRPVGEVELLKKGTVDPDAFETLNRQRFSVRVIDAVAASRTRVQLRVEVPASPSPVLIVPLLVERIDAFKSVPARGLLTRVRLGESAVFDFRLSPRDGGSDVAWQDVLLSVDIPTAQATLTTESNSEGHLCVVVPMDKKIVRGEIQVTYDGAPALTIPFMSIAAEATGTAVTAPHPDAEL